MKILDRWRVISSTMTDERLGGLTMSVTHRPVLRMADFPSIRAEANGARSVSWGEHMYTSWSGWPIFWDA